jgi:predicted acylesterase/phospholipase RssA
MRDLGLTFGGGGNRAFYQVGLLQSWWPALEPRVGAISACSAGACMAVIWLSGRQPETHTYWLSRRKGITRNFEWHRLLRGRRPTPHEPIYRDTMRFALADGGLARIRSLPFPVLVLTAEFPRFVPALAATALGLGFYSLERQLWSGKLHPRVGRAIGFRPHSVDARTCATVEELVDLVLASSATPPFTALGRFRGRRLMDGGMVDNAPAFLVESAPGVTRTLVLLTRPYPTTSIGRQGRRLYLAPTEPVPISRWDYTSVARVEATFALGRRDAAVHGEVIREFLE